MWQKYPDGIIEKLSKEIQNVVSVELQWMRKTIKMGNSRVFNVIILGIAARMDFPKEQWIKVIKKTVPQRLLILTWQPLERVMN